MRVIDQTLISVLNDHFMGCRAVDGKRPLPVAVDDLAFAALLLVSEYANEITNKDLIISAIDQSVMAVVEKGTHSEWHYPSAIDTFALILARDLLIEPNEELAGERFRNLVHSNSEIRRFCFNSIWFYRKHTPPKAVDLLLQNVADTLGYVEFAIGLTRALFQSDEEFFSYAETFQPETYRDQYHSRIKIVKEKNELLYNYSTLFLPLECKVREIICSYSLKQEIQIAEDITGQLRLLT